MKKIIVAFCFTLASAYAIDTGIISNIGAGLGTVAEGVNQIIGDSGKKRNRYNPYYTSYKNPKRSNYYSPNSYTPYTPHPIRNVVQNRISPVISIMKNGDTLGYGVVVDGHEGILVTSSDVIKDNIHVKVKFSNGKIYDCDRVRDDGKNNISALQIIKNQNTVLPAFNLNTKPKAQGESVSIVNRKGQIISNGRVIEPQNYYNDLYLLRISAPSSHDDIGKAVIGKNGSLYGIKNRRDVTPSVVLKDLLRKVAPHSPNVLDDASSTSSRLNRLPQGMTGALYVAGDLPDLPEFDHLRKNDVIVRINGRLLNNENTIAQVAREGIKKLQVIRDGRRINIITNVTRKQPVSYDDPYDSSILLGNSGKNCHCDDD